MTFLTLAYGVHACRIAPAVPVLSLFSSGKTTVVVVDVVLVVGSNSSRSNRNSSDSSSRWQ